MKAYRCVSILNIERRPEREAIYSQAVQPSQSVFQINGRFPSSAELMRGYQAEASSCLNASYNAIPTDVAKFNDRIRGFGIGIRKQRSQFARSKSSGNPRVSLPKI